MGIRRFAAASTPPWAPALLLPLLLLAILGAKLWTIASFGSPTPFWDQWDGEASDVYVPYLEGHLTAANLVGAHNEHRIAASRLIALGLVELNGWWDTRLQMIVNAILHCISLGMLTAMIRPRIEARFFPLVVLATLVTFALPFGWENTIAGFQSQFYLLVCVSLAALYLLIERPVFSLSWSSGLLLACASVLTMASGMLILPAAIAIIAVRTLATRDAMIRHTLAIVAMGAALALLSLSIVHVDGHDPLKAHSLLHFVMAAADVLGWPGEFKIAFLLIWPPAVALAVLLIARRAPASDPAWLLIAIAAWIGLQDLALAYGRAASPLASRYLDLVSLGPVVCLACGVAVLVRLEPGAIRKRTALFLRVAGAFVFLALTITAIDDLPQDLRGRGNSGVAQTANLGAFIRTDDEGHLRDKALYDVPYPSPDRLITLVRDPMVRGLLPRELGVTQAERDAVTARMALKGRLEPIVQILKNLALASGAWIFALSTLLLAALIPALLLQSRQRTPG